MNAPPYASRRSADTAWAAPDPPGPGSGLAWLSGGLARAAPTDPVAADSAPPVGVIGIASTARGPGADESGAGVSSLGGPTASGPSPGGPTASGPSLGGPNVGGPNVGGLTVSVPANGGSGDSSPTVSGRAVGRYSAERSSASRSGFGEAGGGVRSAEAVGGAAGKEMRLPGLAGGWPAGQVVTWLPDGRWVTADAQDDPPPADTGAERVDPGAAARRRGRRRIALARTGARLAGWPRRVLVGLLLLAAVVLAVQPHPAAPAAPAPPATDVVVATRDLAAGTVLAAADLRTVSLPVAVVPAGAAGRPAGLIGRLAAGAIRRGETVTDARVVGPGLTAGLGPGESAAVPVRLADPDSAALVRPGDRVDVLSTPVTPDGAQPAGGDAVDVAIGVRVLAVLGGRDAADGVVLVVAATGPTARRLAGAAARHRLTVSVRPP